MHIPSDTFIIYKFERYCGIGFMAKVISTQNV